MFKKLAVFAMILMLTALIPGCGGEPAKEVKPEAAVKKEEPTKARAPPLFPVTKSDSGRAAVPPSP
jgi:PBP1b-binding outer membrane lipoprotein LpoB